MSKTVPFSLPLGGTFTDSVKMADALLDAGILCSSDWNGHLSESVQAGLLRWLQDIGAFAMKHLSLDFFYTDDLDSLMLDTFHLARAFNLPWGGTSSQNPQIGGFGMMVEGYGHVGNEAVVGERILDLEGLCPGAGYATLAVIEEVVGWCLTGATPCVALEMGNFYQAWGEENSDFMEDEAALPTREEFHANVPRPACTPRYNRRLLQSALRFVGNWERDRGEPLILETALRIDNMLRATGWRHRTDNGPTPLNQVHIVSDVAVPAFLLRWQEGDPITRIVDYHLHSIWEYGTPPPQIETIHGDNATVVYLSAFHTPLQPDQPGSVQRAARNLKDALEICVALDSLLVRLHAGPKRLVQILG